MIKPFKYIWRHSKKIWKKIKAIFPYVVIFLISLFIAATFSLIKVDGSSMYPTYKNNDLIVAYKGSENYKVGDIVIINAKEFAGYDLIVKRVIATEGDTVLISSGKVYINGKSLEEPYIVENNIQMGRTIVPKGQVFVLGDNRGASLDSRTFGCIDKDNIVSKVCYDADWFRGIGQILFSH